MSLLNLQPGDVIEYERRTGEWREGVVIDHPENSSKLVYCYWRMKGISGDWDGPWNTQYTNARVHPDPEPVLVDFAAWMLTR